MLPRAQRLTSTLDYSRVVRHGARYSSPRVVLHIAAAEDRTGDRLARFGFVVSKTVGSAPRRNRVRRQLREIAKANMAGLHGDVVVRALPASSEASWEQLTNDYLRCLRKFSNAQH